MAHLRILLIEDEVDVIELFHHVFWKSAFARELHDRHELVLSVAQTYEDAVRMLSHHADVVFLDNNIPERYFGEEMRPLGYTLLASKALKKSIVIGTSSDVRMNQRCGFALVWNKHASDAQESLKRLLIFCCEKVSERQKTE